MNPATGRVPVSCDRECFCVPHLVEGTGSFRLFTEGDDLFDAFIDAIAGARASIRLESFIFAADAVGWRFAEALAERARAGVDVRLHFDARGGAFKPSAALYRALVEAGVVLRWYHPWSWRHPVRYFQRDHRKLLVVDEEVAFLGGFNIRLENSRTLYGPARQRDSHVSVRGELARLASLLFDRLWHHADDPEVDAVPDDVADIEALLLPNFSRQCQRRLACLYSGLLGRARHTAYLTTPYFCPGTIIHSALRAAARRGVDVGLLVPRHSDPPFVAWTTRSAYATLLEAGVRIHEYLPRKLHAKTSVIDDWAIVGSANMDHLSLFVNHELILIARDAPLAEALRAQFKVDLVDAAEVRSSAWRGRPWQERWLEGIGRAARRFL